jgi:hypothetical protein
MHYEYPQFGNRKSAKPKKRKSFIRERAINPDTNRPFMDRKSKIVAGRVICKGRDMEDLRRRVGIREGEICQGPGCEAWAQLYPPDGHPAGELHHSYGRGMGGGKRNDVAEECQWLCRDCHREAKINPRYLKGGEPCAPSGQDAERMPAEIGANTETEMPTANQGKEREPRQELIDSRLDVREGA